MADLAFPPLDNFGFPTKFFSRPGTVLPILPIPVQGFTDGPDIDDNERDHGIQGSAPIYPGSIAGRGGVSSNLSFPMEMFYDLFWKGKIHLVAPKFDAGNVLTPIQNSFEVYNAGVKLPAASMTGLTQSGVTGITILTGTTVPFTLGLGETESYTYQIDNVGPSTILAQYLFDFLDGQSVTHDITGSRIVLFNHLPQMPIRERWAWLTDIIQAVDGTEQRNSVRDVPRQSWLLRYLTGDEQLNMKIENILAGHAPNQLAFPSFTQSTFLSAAVIIGATVLPVISTTDKDFRIGDDVILRTDLLTFETRTITIVNPTSLTVSPPLLNAFVAGTEVLPLQLGRISNPLSQVLYPINARNMSLEFFPQFNEEDPDESGFTLYKTFPVWEDDILIAGSSYKRNFELGTRRFDSETGAFFDSTQRNFPAVSSAFVIEMPTPAEFVRIKQFLHARRGRQKHFWMSPRRDDFTIGSDRIAGTLIDIDHVNYTIFVFDNSKGNRRDIEIEYIDGTIDRRAIIGSTVVSSTIEQLSIDSASSQALTQANVSQIRYLMRFRLAADTLDFIHEFVSNVGFVNVTIIEVTG